MNKLESVFTNNKVLIPFITCGDPNRDVTKAAVRAMVEGGADIIELGIPFSDPTAESPVVQASYDRALKVGTYADEIFELVSDLRKEITVPFVLVTYANPVFSYGTEDFIRKAASCGIDGIIIPDVPYEEKSEFAEICKEVGISLISVLAPTSTNRIFMIAKDAEGFLYISADAGEGESSTVVSDVRAQGVTLPCVTSASISTAIQAKTAATYSDGVVLPSGVVELLEKYGTEAPSHIAEYIKEIKAALQA